MTTNYHGRKPQTLLTNSKPQHLAALDHQRPDDLVWFIGSVITSYGLLILYVSRRAVATVVARWAILIEPRTSSVLFSRTYLDRTERQIRTRLLWGSLLFFRWSSDGDRRRRLCLFFPRRPVGLLSPGQAALRFHGACTKRERRLSPLSITPGSCAAMSLQLSVRCLYRARPPGNGARPTPAAKQR